MPLGNKNFLEEPPVEPPAGNECMRSWLRLNTIAGFEPVPGTEYPCAFPWRERVCGRLFLALDKEDMKEGQNFPYRDVNLSDDPSHCLELGQGLLDGANRLMDEIFTRSAVSPEYE